MMTSSVSLFMVSFGIGLGPIPWMLASEIIPTEAKDSATAIVYGVSWMSVTCHIFLIIFAGNFAEFSQSIFRGELGVSDTATIHGKI
jgi:hypothetical protein